MAEAKEAPKVLSLAFIADDERSFETLKGAVIDALAAGGLTGVLPEVADGWSQSGGWVREQDGWPQSGGWYLSKNRQKTDDSLPPLEVSVVDVLAAAEKLRAQIR
jgi:hypothetical protein